MNLPSQNRRNVSILLFLLIYIPLGIFTELKFIQVTPLPATLFVDFLIYERTLVYALSGISPYAILDIGQGFLYPPAALFVVEIFHYITPFTLKVLAYTAVNIVLLVWIVYGVTQAYGYNGRQIWYLYIICLGFSPFLELLHLGQINMFTLFGLFILFIYTKRSAVMGGAGLSLAILTKTSPVIFVIYLFAFKKWKVFAAATMIMIISLILSVFRYGSDGVVEYPTVLMYITHQFPLFTNTQSLVAKIAWLREFLSIRYNIAPTLLVYLAEHINITQQLLNLYIAILISISAILLYMGRQPSEYLFIIIALGMMLLPNIMWYHHYVFILLPLIIWMAWTKFNPGVTAWCFFGLLIIQIDRFYLTYGLLIHIFSHLTILILLSQQIKNLIREFSPKLSSRQNQSQSA